MFNTCNYKGEYLVMVVTLHRHYSSRETISVSGSTNNMFYSVDASAQIGDNVT